MNQALLLAALNADPLDRPISAELGGTFGEARALLKRTKLVAIAVAHGPGAADWSYVQLPRAVALRWLNARIAASSAGEARPLRSRLTVRLDDEAWLLIGVPGNREDRA